MNLVSLLLFIYFINDIFSYNFPEVYNNVKQNFIQEINKQYILIEPYTINIMIKLLYYYSILEIKYNKFKSISKIYICEGKKIVNKHFSVYNNNNPIFCELKTKVEIFDLNNNFKCIKVICTSIPIEKYTNLKNELIPDIYQSDNYYIIVTSYLENEESSNRFIFY